MAQPMPSPYPSLLVSRRPLMIGVDDHRQQAFAAVLVSSTAARRFRGECQPAARARACGRRPPDAGVPLRSFAPSMLAAARPSTRVASSQFCSSLTAADAPVGRVRLSPRRQRRRSTCSMAQHTCPCCGLICRKVKILFWHMDRHTRAPLCAHAWPHVHARAVSIPHARGIALALTRAPRLSPPPAAVCAPRRDGGPGGGSHARRHGATRRGCSGRGSVAEAPRQQRRRVGAAAPPAAPPVGAPHLTDLDATLGKFGATVGDAERTFKFYLRMEKEVRACHAQTATAHALPPSPPRAWLSPVHRTRHARALGE